MQNVKGVTQHKFNNTKLHPINPATLKKNTPIFAIIKHVNSTMPSFMNRGDAS